MAFSSRAGTKWCHDFPKLARESGFRFNRHGQRVRVDWKRISSIDIDRVISERDFSAIDDNVNDIVDCSLENEYDVKILDPNFVKLFCLAQLAIEYLLYCKQYLDHSVVILKDELRSKLEESVKLKKQVKSYEETINNLIEQQKEISRGTEQKLGDSHGEIHKCPQCPKTFISSVFMSAHVNRRHPSANLSQSTLRSPVLDERYRAEAEKLHNEIKTLKERLNLTERLIRKEPDKMLLGSDSIAASANDRKIKSDDNSQAQDESNAELQTRREYQEELKNFKETLFSEIRQQNLKLVDKLSSGKNDTDDGSNSNAKELIRQQENEIQRLRDQLYKRVTPDIEDLQIKLNNQEDLWQSKIENLESRHRVDIEKLYAQLEITRESADKIRADYITKINNLERESRVSGNKSMHRPAGSAQSERNGNSSLPRRKSEDRGDSANENVPILVESQPKDRLMSDYVNSVNEEHGNSFHKDETLTNDRNKRPKRRLWGQTNFTFPYDKPLETLANGFEDNSSIDNPRQDDLQISRHSVVAAETTQGSKAKESLATVAKVDKKSTMYPAVTNVPRRESNSSKNRLESSDSVTESDDSSSSTNSNSSSGSSSSSNESQQESESAEISEAIEISQKRSTEEGRISRLEVKSNNRNELLNLQRVDSGISSNNDAIEQLNSKLRDLGVDPEWQGIPRATLKHIMERVKHHRNLSSKKYRKLDEIRRELFDQVSRRVASEMKIAYSHKERSPESPLKRLSMTTKGERAWKAPSALDKNDESHKSVRTSKNGSRQLNDTTEKPTNLVKSSNEINENEQVLRSAGKSKSREPMRNDRPVESQTSKQVPRIVGVNTAAPKKQQQSSVNSPSRNYASDPKYLSHSYESIKSFRQYEGSNNSRQQRNVWEGKINVPETLVASSPQINEEGEKVATRNNRDSPFTFTNDTSTIEVREDDEDEEDEEAEFFSKTPRSRLINRSVIKSTTRGSASSLIKKKVVFDLESTAKESPDSVVDKDNDRGVTNRDFGESDTEISSMNEEVSEKLADREEKPLGTIALKTLQSEKIAQISKLIEHQLSITRRKPIGSIEAMFANKLTVTENNDNPAISETRKQHLDITSPGRSTADFPQAAPRTLRNLSSEPRRNSDNRNYENKDANLDRDIDELLEIE